MFRLHRSVENRLRWSSVSGVGGGEGAGCRPVTGSLSGQGKRDAWASERRAACAVTG